MATIPDASRLFFESIELSVVDRLIKRSVFKKIVNLYSAFPRSFFEPGILFEMPFKKKENRVDISLKLSSPSDQILRDVGTMQNKDPGWATLLKLLIAWKKRESSLSKRIQCIGLEFDVEGELPKSPNIFIIFNTPLSSSEYLLQIIELLTNLSFSSEEHIKKAQTCIGMLPNGSAIRAIGLMIPRTSAPIRMSLVLKTEKDLLAYLKNIDYSFDLSSLINLYSYIKNQDDGLNLSMDIYKKKISNRIGLTMASQSLNVAENGNHHPIYNILLDQKICTSNSYEKCLKFPQLIKIQKDSNAWLNNLNYPTSEFALINIVHHIKLCFIPPINLFAKGYFLIAHRPINVDFISNQVKKEISKNGEHQ